MKKLAWTLIVVLCVGFCAAQEKGPAVLTGLKLSADKTNIEHLPIPLNEGFSPARLNYTATVEASYTDFLFITPNAEPGDGISSGGMAYMFNSTCAALDQYLDGLKKAEERLTGLGGPTLLVGHHYQERTQLKGAGRKQLITNMRVAAEKVLCGEVEGKVAQTGREGRFTELRQLGSVLTKSLFGTAVNYGRQQWPKLIRFLEDGRIELDNNLIYAARCINAIVFILFLLICSVASIHSICWLSRTRH